MKKTAPFSRRLWTCVMACAWFTGTPLYGQTYTSSEPLTRAEASGFEETSRYEDVVQFISGLAEDNSDLHLTSFGYTFEGRKMPLVVWGENVDGDPQTVRDTGKTRIFVMANIHAGEVCGKEAMQMLLRDLAAGKNETWKDSLILLVAPIYNADGNERIRLSNRPRQHGPLAGMGQRPNAQEYDLNRDHMKLDSPEARSLVRLFNEFDPHVVIDLHTTNGTPHAYHITYAPPLHPNTSGRIDSFLREELLPDVTSTIEEKYGWYYYHYGNLPWGRNSDPGWFTFDHRPRFSNNYAGLRNRIGILSEAFAYVPFEDRVLATYYFVEEILEYVHDRATRIRVLTEQADAEPLVGQRLGVQAEFKRSEQKQPILMSETVPETNPYSGEIILERTDLLRVDSMHTYIAFTASETERVPAAYFVPENLDQVLNKLAAHGVYTEILTADMEWDVESFSIDSTQTAERPFQQHNERMMWGKWIPSKMLVKAGTRVVPMNQPLSRLAFSLLEPRSDDGFVNWNVLDRQLANATIYPVLRSFKSWHLEE